MVISSSGANDSVEESGLDRCTTCCVKGLPSNPSLNPSSLCTQHHNVGAPQPPEEDDGQGLQTKASEECDAEEIAATEDELLSEAVDNAQNDKVGISFSSPSHLLIRRCNATPTETHRVVVSVELGALMSKEQMAIALLTKPSTSPPVSLDSSSELQARERCTAAAPSHSSPSFSGNDYGQEMTCGEAQLHESPPLGVKRPPLSSPSSTPCLDPNAREFFPPSSQQSSDQECRVRHVQVVPRQVHYPLGAHNLDMSSSNAIVCDPPQHNHDIGTPFYTPVAPLDYVGYHSPFLPDLRFHANQEGTFNSTNYSGFYQTVSQYGYPITPGGIFARPPPPLHSVGLSPLPSAAMAPTPLATTSLVPSNMQVVAQSFASAPSIYTAVDAREAQHRNFSHSQKHLTHSYSHGLWKEHVSRTLLITGLPHHINEVALREQLESWGAIRGIQADLHPEGLQVLVQFFDLRASRQALKDMQAQYAAHNHYNHIDQHHHSDQEGCVSHSKWGLLCGSVISVQYISSWGMPVADAHNQGTLVLFNVGIEVNVQEIRRIFEAYGNVREVREAPTKRQHKFVEFYDIRAAAAAWNALNGKEICGKCVKIEFSRQGGAMARRQRAQQDKARQELVAEASGQGIIKSSDQIIDHSSWSGTAPGVMNVSRIGLQLGQGWESWPSHEGGGTLHFPLNLCMEGSPHRLSMPLYPEVGFHHNERKENGSMSDAKRSQAHPESSRITVGQPNCVATARERQISVPRPPKSHGHFQFNEVEMYMHPENPKTTLMIQNIPNKYSQKMLLATLDQHCSEVNSSLGADEPEAAYDFMYLPIDFKNKCNLGYAFVNFTSPRATFGFYKSFHKKAWEAFNSRKICEIAFARLQGRSALEDHFRNSRFACDTEEYLPVLFIPPRNGSNESMPRVAVGQSGGCRAILRNGNGHSSGDVPDEQDGKVHSTKEDSCGDSSETCDVENEDEGEKAIAASFAESQSLAHSGNEIA
ncbi:hypothetical protein KP509_39G026900 [Ceratopteris richardii]|uniref:RRM domain-containing protein n=1 Tax=Ceratopteris richardii TaxID=49495 RepID=A0A8T2PZ48_CERRI|nr:hypothetical protein KP509_39G026900 [Ceratopteris richardii]